MRAKITTYLFVMLGLFFSVVVIGCSFKPSEADAKKVVQGMFQEEIKKNMLKINRVTKTNGQEINLMGRQFYEMQAEVELEYLADVVVATNPFGRRGRSIALSTYNSMGYWQKFEFESTGIVRRHSVGEKELINLKLAFAKTEKGWVPQ